MDVHFMTSYQQLFLYLEAGRADVAIRNDWQTQYQIKKLGFTGKIVMLPQSMTSEPQAYSILIGKRSPFIAHIERLNTVLKEMERDGTLQTIYNHYK
jgi:polar amino acid transport system substrate-binding protein